MKAKALWYVAYSSKVGVATKTVMSSRGVLLSIKQLAIEDRTMNEDWMKNSEGGVFAGYAWPFEEETQTIIVTGGPVFEPVMIDC